MNTIEQIRILRKQRISIALRIVTRPRYVIDFYATPVFTHCDPLFILHLHRTKYFCFSDCQRENVTRVCTFRLVVSMRPYQLYPKLYLNNWNAKLVVAYSMRDRFVREFSLSRTWHSFAKDSILSCALSNAHSSTYIELRSRHIYSFTFLLLNKEGGCSRNKRGRFKWRRKGGIKTYTWRCRRILSCCPKPIYRDD